MDGVRSYQKRRRNGDAACPWQELVDLEEQRRRFWDRYPMDERATELLLQCAEDLQMKAGI